MFGLTNSILDAVASSAYMIDLMWLICHHHGLTDSLEKLMGRKVTGWGVQRLNRFLDRFLRNHGPLGIRYASLCAKDN